MKELFDEWPEKYDRWFETPTGRLIKGYESALIHRMLAPAPGESILDAGCGTGIFTADILKTGATVVGLELALSMLQRARTRLAQQAFQPIAGDMLGLPFVDDSFHKSVSVTAIEFIDNATFAVEELFRVTKPGGIIVVATLNALSPWAQRRREAAQKGHPLFRHTVFRFPEAVKDLYLMDCVVQSAIHFQKDDDLDIAQKIEESGSEKGLETGAFLAARWIK